MARSILILSIGCVVMIAIAWNISPDFIERGLPPLARFRNLIVPAPPAVTKVIEVPDKKITKKSGGTRSLVVLPSPVSDAPVANTVETPSEASQPISQPIAILKPISPLPVFRVSTADVPLFSANNPAGRVLFMLKKDEVVEPQLRFNNQGQEWTYVTVADKTVSGFIQSNKLYKTESNSVDQTVSVSR